jgi:hypothetical protein
LNISTNAYEFYTIEPVQVSWGQFTGEGIEKFVVSWWDLHPRSSVLAGQERKTFVAEFSTLEEALANYPQSDVCDQEVPVSNTVGHLPDEEMSAYEEEHYFLTTPIIIIRE